MKRTFGECIPVLVIIIGLIIGFIGIGSVVTAAWDYTPAPKPAKDIMDFLAPVPRVLAQEYGFTDRTVVMYNITALRETCRAFDVRIKVLEAQVKVLTPKPEPEDKTSGE